MKPDSNSQLKIKYVRKPPTEPAPMFTDQFGRASTGVDVLRMLSYSLSKNGVTTRQFLANYDLNSENADKAAKFLNVTEVLDDAIDAAEQSESKKMHELLEFLESEIAPGAKVPIENE